MSISSGVGIGRSLSSMYRDRAAFKTSSERESKDRVYTKERIRTGSSSILWMVLTCQLHMHYLVGPPTGEVHLSSESSQETSAVSGQWLREKVHTHDRSYITPIT